jgi:hypothetical protein
MHKVKRIPRGIWVAILLIIIFQVLFDPLSTVEHLGERLQARIYLPAAREKWESQGISHYIFDIQGYVPLLCMFGGRIEVKDRVVIPGLISDVDTDPIAGLSPGFSGLKNPPLCNDQNYTMPLLFDEIERWLKDSPLSITQISFDPQYGFISSFKFGNPGGRGLLNPIVSDCCGGFAIENFQVLDE